MKQRPQHITSGTVKRLLGVPAKAIANDPTHPLNKALRSNDPDAFRKAFELLRKH